MLVILKAGNTHNSVRQKYGDFDQMVIEGLGIPANACTTVDITHSDLLPDPSNVSALVVTGAHLMITDRPGWLEPMAEWVAEVVAEGAPTLGICFGHQLIAHALGGVVQKNPRGLEIGTTQVTRECDRNDPVLGSLPPVFSAQVAHYETVTKLPPGSRSLGQSYKDPNQMFKVGEYTWCVQFHPEFSADTVREYIQVNQDAIDSQGEDASALLRQVEDTREARGVLRNFATLVMGN